MPPKRIREVPCYTPTTPPKPTINPEGAPVFIAPSSQISVNHGIQEEALKNMLNVLKSVEDGIEILKKRLETLDGEIGERLTKVEHEVENLNHRFEHLDSGLTGQFNVFVKLVENNLEKVLDEVEATHRNVKGTYTQVLEVDETLDAMKETLGGIEDRVEILSDEATLKSYEEKK